MNLKYILTIVILVAIISGGILAYRVWMASKEETKVPEEIIKEEIDQCKDIQDLGKQSKCYTDLAKETEDEAWCEKIEFREGEANCYSELAVLKNDSSICWKVETASLASSCWEHFEMKDWKTYRNDKYGYEIKHPEDWRINLKFAPEEVIFVEENNLICNFVIKKRTSIEGDISFLISRGYLESDIILFGFPTKKFVSSEVSSLVHYYLKRGEEDYFQIGHQVVKKPIENVEYPECVEIFNQILSTFRFLE